MSQTDFINKIKKGAIKSMEKHGVLASITIAQAIQESGWGKTGLASNYNNLFGIKSIGGWTGKSVNLKTGEYRNGQHVTENWGFRVYDSVDESIEDHALFLVNNSRYRKAGFFNSKNYVNQANALQEAGYATDPTYAKSLIRIIEMYKLNEYDKMNSFDELRYVKPCMKGERVTLIQTILKKLGYMKGEIDGKFGSITQDAVLAYQKEHTFLNQRAIVDEETWNSIMAHK